jgi:hypothetical protein
VAERARNWAGSRCANSTFWTGASGDDNRATRSMGARVAVFVAESVIVDPEVGLSAEEEEASEVCAYGKSRELGVPTLGTGAER